MTKTFLMSGTEEDPMENAGQEQGRMGNRIEPSKPGDANGLDSLDGHDDRGEDERRMLTEERQ